MRSGKLHGSLPLRPAAVRPPTRYDDQGSYVRAGSSEAPPGREPVLLLGRDHDCLGQVAVRSLGGHVGLAISRGAVDKPRWYVDPNEDGALAAQGRSGWLLAVADGHHGAEAAEAALAGVASACTALDDGWSSPDLIVNWAVDAARTAVTERLGDRRGRHIGSRTALSVAVVSGSAVHVATYGDTTAVRVRGARGKEVGATSPFLGPRSPYVPVRTTRLRRHDVLVLASDGLADGLGPQLRPALAAAAAEPSPTEAARRLVSRALQAQADDNVTAVVWTPSCAPDCCEVPGHGRTTG